MSSLANVRTVEFMMNYGLLKHIMSVECGQGLKETFPLQRFKFKEINVHQALSYLERVFGSHSKTYISLMLFSRGMLTAVLVQKLDFMI